MLAFLGVSAVPAYADDGGSPPSRPDVPSPTGTPPARPGDPFGGRTPPQGPIIIITPGSSGTALPAPADPDDLSDLTRTPQPGKGATVAPSDTATDEPPGLPGASGTTAAPGVPGIDVGRDDPRTATGSAATGSSAVVWWVVAGVVLLLLAAGAVIAVRMRRRRPTEDLPVA